MSPDQEKAANAWKDGARDAFDTAEKLYASKKYHHALFFCHLAVEKALKAAYMLEHNKMPPHTHDLVLLASRLSMPMGPEQLNKLAEITTFNIDARYDEEKLALYRKATVEYTTQWMAYINDILKTFL